MRVAVYCGANPGTSPEYVQAARQLGEALAHAEIGVVYGGASRGLMGALADAALAAGGEVIGVLPRSLSHREIQHVGLSELHLVDTMHQRKALISELADAFAVLPGGMGTLDEFFEAWTWAQIGIHSKPIALLDIGGFYQPLLAYLRTVVNAGFLTRERLDSLVVCADVDSFVNFLSEPDGEIVPPRYAAINSVP
ncbi:MAG: TIGR00730 family Rossman fold protein [Gemmatimonadaceae bacterium]